MNLQHKFLLITLIVFTTIPCRSQNRYIDFGLGVKYDHFTVTQPESVFKTNFDMGALAFVNYGQKINDKLGWEAGIATNNYKINLRINDPDGTTIYAPRELVSVMRSNRLYLNLQHATKKINNKLSWYITVGVSLLFGTKNPYDVILEKSKEVETSSGNKSILVRIQTFGLTGSAILLGASSRLSYTINKDFNLLCNLGIMSGTGTLTKTEINYVLSGGSNYKQAIIATNGLSFSLTFGVRYLVNK
jgi:hypothetical protein